MEGQIAISELLQRFPSLYLDADSGSLRWHRGIFLRGLQRLPLGLE
jgi:cytochrome P450